MLGTALAFSFSACNDDDDDDDVINAKGDTALVGQWRAMRQTWNGTPMESQNLIITMNSNLTGVVSDNGETEHNDFTYRVDDGVIYITILHGGPGFELPYRYEFENGHLVLAGSLPPAGGVDAYGDYLGYFEKIN